MQQPPPIPPFELRELVGTSDPQQFENPTGAPIFADLPDEAWESYLDFGCGCGRSARRLLQQRPRPRRYVGVDLHRGMVRWCQVNITPLAPEFTFVHHDVFSPCFNPDRSRPWAAPLPVDDGSVTLAEATSVFTHLTEGQAEYYLDEVARVLAPHGRLVATWFLFDKVEFPFMQDNQNALYINDRDPTNAVVFDRAWLVRALDERGLAVVGASPPAVRGHHTQLIIGRPGHVGEPIDLPQDDAPVGRQPPPLVRSGADLFGLEGASYGVSPTTRSRQEPPAPDPLAVELRGAKEYIASLTEHINAVDEHRAVLQERLDTREHELAAAVARLRELGERSGNPGK